MYDQLANTQIGDFYLQDLMERRVGMTLYRATQQSLKRFTVVKIIDTKSIPLPPSALEDDFPAFAARVVGIEHMHLQPIYAYGIVDDQYIYIAARFMAGNLYQLLRTGALPVDLSIQFMLQMSQALIFVHTQGLIHSSLSPRNVYVDETTNAFIDDLELSRIIQAARSLDDLKKLIDEPFYLSVEQLERAPLDFRADMYAVGAILYHMLTGMPPFVGGDNSFESVLARKQRNQVRPLRHLKPGIPALLDDAVLRMLRADPGERFPDFGAFEAALRQAGDGSQAGTESLLSRLRKIISRDNKS